MRHDNSTIRHDKLKFSLKFQKVTTFLLVQLLDGILEIYLEQNVLYKILLQHFAIKLRSGVVRTLSKICYGVFSKHEWLITQKIHWITSAVNISNYMESLSITYSFADSQKAPVHVSDRLIFCCGNLILHQIKKWKLLKDKIYDEKHQKKKAKKWMKTLCRVFSLNSPR